MTLTESSAAIGWTIAEGDLLFTSYIYMQAANEFDLP
jgi:hypothetical protein